MKKTTTLVIMAAGMGSRFGGDGLKQITTVGRHGEIIADYSIYDAKRAGFNKVIFIIKREMEKTFREIIFDRISKIIEAEIVYQELQNIPDGFSVPNDRKKPWGTGHAVLCCSDVIKEPFSVINADDFYGKSAFEDIYGYITNPSCGEYDYCMAGYLLKNTVTESGYVSRGICSSDKNGYLNKIVETTHIQKNADGSIVCGDGNGGLKTLDPDTIVSMSAWGFKPSFLYEAKLRFNSFFKNMQNPISEEYYLPSIVGQLLSENKANVKILPSKDMWYGFTYKEDIATVQNAILKLTDDGHYPNNLWK